jgi:hypothetical protein
VSRVSSFELPISASHIHLLRVLPVVGCRSKTPTPGGQRGQVRAAWWQQKQDEVVDRSRCRVTAHNRSLHSGFAVVHHKTDQISWLSHKTKTGGLAGEDEIRAHREASKQRTHVGITWLAPRLREGWSPGIRPMVLQRHIPKVRLVGAYLLLLWRWRRS